LKPKEVNRYRSGIHNPEIEVLVYRGEEATKVYIVDWKKGKIEMLEKK
jgi:hypothetical protein